MTVKGIPDKNINLAGNLPDILITSKQPIDVKLFSDDVLLLDESYTPDENSHITLNIIEVVISALKFKIPDAEKTIQSELVKSFTLLIGNDSYTFSAIRAGLRTLSLTPAQWLTANFLTWQPQYKTIYAGAHPEYLTCYATENSKMYVKAYFADNTSNQAVLYSLEKGVAYTLETSFGKIYATFGKTPLYFDIWLQNDIEMLSYVQRYICKERPAELQTFVFQNSLGGLDMACFAGENISKPDYEAKKAKIENISVDYQTDKTDTYSQSTGYLSLDEALWLHDFFKSKARYIAKNGALQPITLSEATPEKSNKDDLCAFTFEYQLAKQSDYMDISRNHAALHQNITLTDPAQIPFDIAPRLLEFSEIALSDIALFPVQSPYEQKWYRTSLGAIVKHMVTAVVGSDAVQSSHYHSNMAVLEKFSINSNYLYTGDSKAKVGHADTAEQAETALFANKAATAEFADLAETANLALTAKHADLADLATLAKKATIADNAVLWDNHKFADYLNQPVRTIDDVQHKSISAPLFVSGFSGSGWRIDADSHLTVDNLTVRKQMNVYELQINKIRATNGSLWVSDSAKIIKVTEEQNNYTCYIDTDNNKNPVPFKINDIIRCHSWSGKNIKYFSAKVATIGTDYFTLVKSTFDTAAKPTAGDELIRIGNATDTDRQGALYLTSSDNNAPYFDVIDKVTTTSLTNKTKVRLGKLNGITDADFGGSLSGYGLYADNAYIKGKIHITGGNAATKTDITDTQTALAADAQTKATAAQTAAKNYTDALKNTLKSLAYLDKVELAKLGTTIIEGGYIKTNLINANAIIVNGNLADKTDVSNAQTAAISTATTAAQTKVDALKNTLKSLAYLDKVELAKLGSTIIEGGYIKTNLINANAIIVNGNLADKTDVSNAQKAAINTATTAAQTKVDALKNTLKSLAYLDTVELAKLGTTIIEGGYIKTNLINANAIIVNGNLADKTDVSNAQKAAINTAAADTNNKIINLNLGGTNIFKTSGQFGATVTNWANNGGGLTVDNSKKFNGYNTIKTTVGAGIAGFHYKLENNVVYTYSAMIWSNANMPNNGNTPLHYHAGFNNQNQGKIQIIAHSGNIIANQWNKAFITFKLTSDADSFRPFIYYAGGTAVFNIAYLKLEFGDKATDWTPNPADVAADSQTKATAAQTAAVNTAATAAQAKVDALKNTLKSLAYLDTVETAKLGSTIIDGGYIKTSLIDAEALKAKIITADYISALAVNFKQGKIGGFTINDFALKSNGMTLHAESGQILWTKGSANHDIVIGGIDVGGFISENAMGTLYHTLALFENQKQSSQHNVAIQVTAKNSTTENTAILMKGGYISGFAQKARRVDTTQTLNETDVWITCTNNSKITLTLPPPEIGRTIYIKRGYGEVYIAYNTRYIVSYNNINNTLVSITYSGDTYMFVYDGFYWQLTRMNYN